MIWYENKNSRKSILQSRSDISDSNNSPTVFVTKTIINSLYMRIYKIKKSYYLNVLLIPI